MNETILIKDGILIDPLLSIHQQGNIFIKNGFIESINESKHNAEIVLDAKGCFVCPGFVDMHVHLREPGFEHKETIETGKQVTPNIVENILKDYILNTNSDNIIFDWLVRNIWNKETADKILDSNYKVVFFDLDEKESMRRLLWRMYNPKTWETFMALTESDPKTWDTLVKRSDDEEKFIKQRIKEFYEKTIPVVKIYEKEWKLIKINANQDINKVSKDIINNI